MNRDFILSCFGINEKYLSSFDVIEDQDLKQITVFVEFYKSTFECPYCKSKNINIQGYYKTKLNNNILRNVDLILVPKIRRYKCLECSKTFKENINISPFKHQLTNKIVESIKIDLCKMLSYSDIAKEYNISSHTVMNIFDSMPELPIPPFPSVICVDEFKFSNDVRHYARYPFVISDPFTSSIIDIVEYRTKPVLSEYFEKIPKFRRDFVNFFITDMNQTYRSIKKKYFPKAIHIVDHFHIAKLFTSKLQSMRIRIMKENKTEQNIKEYKCLKNNWKFFLMRKYKAMKILIDENGMVEDIYLNIQQTFKHYSEFRYLYNAREEFFDTLVKMKEYKETCDAVDFFIQKFIDSEIKEVREIGSSINNWREEIINAYAKNEYGFCLTNAVAESNNNYIKTLIHMSHGFVNFHRFRKRILYINAYRNQYKKD